MSAGVERAWGGNHPEGPTTIATRTGGAVDLARPRPEDVRLVDVARGLAMTCRFGGQTDRFMSVAEHSVLCAWVARRLGGSPEAQRLALLHDAPEAYLGDVVKPLKDLIGPAYRVLEARFEAAVFERFGLFPSRADHELVKRIDLQVRFAEGVVVQTSEHWRDPRAEPLPERLAPRGLEWRAAERLFLWAADDLGIEEKGA